MPDRIAILETFYAMLAQGYSKKRACRKIGVSAATIYRWERQPIAQTTMMLKLYEFNSTKADLIAAIRRNEFDIKKVGEYLRRLQKLKQELIVFQMKL